MLSERRSTPLIASGERSAVFFEARAAAVHGGVEPAALIAEGIDPAEIVDFSSNQAPLGIAPEARAAASQAVLDAYPERDATALATALARRHRVVAAQVVVGNGSTELIRLIAQLALRQGDVALSAAPSFGEYRLATELARGRFVEHPLRAGPRDASAAVTGFRYDHGAFVAALAAWFPRLCWICSPNNPTGVAVPPGHIATLVTDHPDTLFVLDEAYCDLLASPQWTQDLLRCGNLAVLRSMTKAWGLAGLRLGYVIADERLAGPLRNAKPPWNVNACAQAAGLAALSDLAHHARVIDLLRTERDRLIGELRARGWTVEPTSAGFFLIRVGDATSARKTLLTSGCLVRDCSSFGLPEYVRVSPRHVPQNERLLEAFSAMTPPQASR